MERLIVVVGGKLQGTEAVYLAKKAGIKTVLIDKDPAAPASGICDRFIAYEFNPVNPFPSLSQRPDLILPAVENDRVLNLLQEWANMIGVPVGYSPDAYEISSSKIKSNTLFQALDLPTPLPWPSCGFPLVIKPDKASGSQGVEVIPSLTTFQKKISDIENNNALVVQEYIEGPSYSIEVMGLNGQYHALQVTDLGMDACYDCNRVTAPTKLSDSHVKEMEKIALSIAQEIQLNGIMDLEVIFHQGTLKILEIDARLPSQTPMAVYWSTELNMVDLMVCLYSYTPCSFEFENEQPVLIEHIQVTGDNIQSLGEHIMGNKGPLSFQTDFFGADEALTTYTPERIQWVATLIFTGASEKEVEEKRNDCFAGITVNFQLQQKGNTHDSTIL